MARVARTIEVEVPVRTAYNQWTQFEDFPRFMEGVQAVHQLDDRRLHWRAKVGGKEREWDAEIREQIPDQRVIWTNTSGAENAGVVTFEDLGPERTRIHLEMSYDPEGVVEHVGDALGFFSRRVEGDLQRFKDFIESRGAETGAWRGELENPQVPGGHTSGAAATGAYRSEEAKGQRANLEGKDPRTQQGNEEYVDTSAEMRTPGALEPGSLSREPHQRGESGYTGRDTGPGASSSVYREDGPDYPES